MIIDKPGLYDMTAETYHADPVKGGSLSASWARKLMEPAGPARFIHERRTGAPFKKVFEFGHAAHSLVLGVGQELVEIPADSLATNGAASTKEAKAFMAQARGEGKIPLKAEELAVVHAMAAALQAHPEAVEALNPDGMHEASAFRRDPESGMWLRSRFDAITPGSHIGDYKTIVDADPGKFARRTAHELGYHQQAAWYSDMAEALDLVGHGAPFRFVLQEKTAPYLVSVVELDSEYIHLGRMQNRAAIDLYARCVERDEWPGFRGIATVAPPKWLADDIDQLPPDFEAELAAYAARLQAEGAQK